MHLITHLAAPWRLSTLFALWAFAYLLGLPQALQAQVELPSGQERSPYSVQIPMEGDNVLRVGGTLPFGLFLHADGTLSGTPSYPGSYGFVARVDGPSGRVRQEFQVEIEPWQSIAALPCGGSVSFSLTAEARAGERVFDLDAPGAAAFFSIPIGPDTGAVTLSLTGEGEADGALLLPRTSFGPGSVEIYTHSIIEDHPGGESLHLTEGTPEYSLAAYREDGLVPVTVAATTPGDFTLAVACSEGVGGGPEALPNGAMGQGYVGQIFPYGGVPPHRFEADGLPQGLSLDGASGLITGIPTEPGRYTLALKVIDNAGSEDEWSATLWVPEPLTLACGETIQGAFERSAFPWEQGLRTPGGVHFVTVPVSESLSGITLTLNGDNGGYSPVLFVGAPGAALGESQFEAYPRYRFDEGAGASMVVDSTTAPWLGAYESVSVAVAASGGSGAFELSLTCDSSLSLPPFLPHPPLGQAYTASLDVRGEVGGSVGWSIVSGALPEGLSLDGGTGVISGVATAGGGEVVIEALSDGMSVQMPYTLEPGFGACGAAEPLTCGDFILGDLGAAAWVNRGTLDLSVSDGVDVYCLLPPPDGASLEVTLSPISGANADLLGGWPGVNPGTRDAHYYGLSSTLDGEDELIFHALGYPGWGDGAPIALAVPAFEAGSYTLEVLCD